MADVRAGALPQLLPPLAYSSAQTATRGLLGARTEELSDFCLSRLSEDGRACDFGSHTYLNPARATTHEEVDFLGSLGAFCSLLRSLPTRGDLAELFSCMATPCSGGSLEAGDLAISADQLRGGLPGSETVGPRGMAASEGVSEGLLGLAPPGQTVPLAAAVSPPDELLESSASTLSMHVESGPPGTLLDPVSLSPASPVISRVGSGSPSSPLLLASLPPLPRYRAVPRTSGFTLRDFGNRRRPGPRLACPPFPVLRAPRSVGQEGRSTGSSPNGLCSLCRWRRGPGPSSFLSWPLDALYSGDPASGDPFGRGCEATPGCLSLHYAVCT